MDSTQAEEWLDREDSVCRGERLTRIEWLAERYPQCNAAMFQGGRVTMYLFEEARYCFVYGQYLAAIALGVAFLERQLAAQLYSSNRDDLECAPFSRLTDEAHKLGFLSKGEFDQLEELRHRRNPILHFQRPFHRDSLDMRALEAEEHPYNLLEQDARLVLQLALRMMGTA